jgi:hypothetical protein
MHRRLVLLLVLVALAAAPVFASHSWGGYHWARQSNPFTMKVNDNLSSNWEPYLQEAVQDWNSSNVFDFVVIWQNELTSDRKCGSVAGQIEICNTTYGQNGWLGIAGISVSGTHITKGYTKLNDTYFNMAQYNTPAWRRLVTCQEIAHDIGLAHQDETFNNTNLGSCMDYTNDPDGGAGGFSSNDPSNEHPNSHDFSMISSIYNHNDSTTTISALPILGGIAASAAHIRTIDEIIAGPESWGTPVQFDKQGRGITFIKIVGFSANGEEKEITHVFWALEADRQDNPHFGDHHD